jgi:GT2 family glycosyltransferase
MDEISVFIINFNGKRTVLDTIRSIYKMEGVKVKIHVIDDCSTDGSQEMIREVFPEIPIYIEPCNTGKPNLLRNKAIEMSETDRLFITDNDILYDLECLSELIKAMKKDKTVATCTPRLMYWDDPQRIYRASTLTHFIGACIGEDRGKHLSKIDKTPVLHSGGGILLLDRTKGIEIGGFDEDYMHGWGEDGEFYQRFLIVGYKCLYVPTAFAYHEDKLYNIREKRVVGQIYNRWQYILTHYSSVTLIVLTPAFLLYDISQILLMSLKRMLFLYCKSHIIILIDLPKFIKKRKSIQNMRKVSDREVLFSGGIFISSSLLKNNWILNFSLDILNRFFELYWKLVRPLIP